LAGAWQKPRQVLAFRVARTLQTTENKSANAIRLALDLVYTLGLQSRHPGSSWKCSRRHMESAVLSYLFFLLPASSDHDCGVHSRPGGSALAFRGLMDAPDVTALQGELGVGNDNAAVDLVVLLCSELRSLASRYLRWERLDHTLQPPPWCTRHIFDWPIKDQREVRWKNRARFTGVVAQLMRRILVDYSRSRDAAKRGKGRIGLFCACLSCCSPPLARRCSHERKVKNLLLATADYTRAREVLPCICVATMHICFASPG